MVPVLLSRLAPSRKEEIEDWPWPAMPARAATSTGSPQRSDGSYLMLPMRMLRIVSRPSSPKCRGLWLPIQRPEALNTSKGMGAWLSGWQSVAGPRPWRAGVGAAGFRAQQRPERAGDGATAGALWRQVGRSGGLWWPRPEPRRMELRDCSLALRWSAYWSWWWSRPGRT